MNNSIRVAILDDDESVRRALGRLLRSNGIDSDAFGAVDDFLRSRAVRTPDCLLLDMRMPDMSGEEVLERLEALQYNMPKIVITAYSDDAERILSRFPSVCSVLSKPVCDTELVAGIKAAVRTRRAN